MPAKKEETKKVKAYDASSISVLEGLEPVRKRPGMYIGTTGLDGLHHLIWEIFDNSRDEAMGGFANKVEVALLPHNYIRVVDNGRGIPVDIHKHTKVSALETIMTTLHAGGKFGGEDTGYKVSGGLHGVGASVVNALSTHMRIDVHKDGGHYVQEYNIGVAKAKVKQIGKTSFNGTIAMFQADPTIFPEIKYDWKRIVGHLRQQAYLVKGLHLTVIDARESEAKLDGASIAESIYLADSYLEVPSMSFYFQGGLKSLVAFNNHYQKPVHKNIFYVEKNDMEGAVLSVEVALQYVDDIQSRISAFANNIYNPEHGTHITGFKTALTRTLNNYAKKNNFFSVKDKDAGFTGDDVLEGLTCVVSVKMPEIQFEGQTKGKLGSVEARGAVESIFSDAFNAYLEENPDDAKAIINKVVIAVKARKAAKAAKDSVLRKGALEGMSLPGKLADCQTKSAAESELFIVEGDSAGGCFSGDTKIALLDGRDITLKEIVQERQLGTMHHCYTIDNNGKVAIGEVLHPRITKHGATVVKVILDNNEEIVCTPDHRFMLRDGTYKPASELVSGTSLMPLYRQYSKKGGRITIDGYEMVYDPSESYWRFTHLLSDQFNQTRDYYQKNAGDHIHHRDFNKLNNDPSNLVSLSREAHLKLHQEHASLTLHTEESKEKSRNAHRDPVYRKKMSEKMSSPEMKELLSANAKLQWENDEYKQFMAEKFLEFYNTNAEYRESSRLRLLDAQNKYWSSDENRKKQSVRTHKFFDKNPHRKVVLSENAKDQWTDDALLQWRSETTKTQWTEAFRIKRKIAYNQTYLNKMLSVLHGLYEETGTIDFEKYDAIRKKTGDKSLIKTETIANNFFGGNLDLLKEAAILHNHKVVRVEEMTTAIDVYDFEVPNTHNFALASGVFVHNSAKMGRDRRTQAILPLRGKILNVERARIDKMLASEQIRNLVIALGTAIGDVFDVEKLRYHKVIIATDADVDGAHIRTLLLTLFYRYFKPLIEGGFIYIAQPPLYKIQQGKMVAYAYNDQEKFAIVGEEEIPDITEVDANAPAEVVDEEEEEVEDTKKSTKFRIQRYKGLGEMNAEELWETTMNPTNRILKQVNIDDAQEADKVFDILMGTDVANRKFFIQSNAHTANLDI